MKINIAHLKKVVGAREKKDLQVNPDELDLENAKHFMNPITVNLEISNSGEVIMAEGSLHTKIRQTCSRCLDAAILELNVDFKEHFKEMPEQCEDDEQDSEFYSFSGDFLDLRPILKENLIVSMPMKTICNPDCKGLCPYCGINLNQASCTCSEAIVDPRLANLRQLLDP